LDLSPKNLYTDNNKNVGYNLGDAGDKLVERVIRLNKVLSKKIGSKKFQKKSSNYLKLNMKLTKLYDKVKNKRKDNLHKQSTDIIGQYDIVCVRSKPKRIGC
jgi:putative transposase